MSARNSPRGNSLRITRESTPQSRLARRPNRVMKVVQCAQTYVCATYSITGSEEMRWPSQRSVQLPLLTVRHKRYGNHIDRSVGSVFARWRRLGIPSLAQLELETAVIPRTYQMATSLATNHASEAAIVFIELAPTRNNRRMKTRSGRENRKLQHTERAEARFRSRNPGTSQTGQCGRNRETRASNPRVLQSEH
jgi:hypothetical protein